MTREEYFKSGHEEMHVKFNEYTAKVDFTVSVDESLVPPYNPGDILMIQKQPDVFQDEIGLFLIDGKPHIKKRGKNELLSLNPGIAPVPIDCHVQGLGKVIGVLNPDWIIK